MALTGSNEVDVPKTKRDYEPLPLEIGRRQQPKTEWIILLTSFILAHLHLSQVAEVISFHLAIEDFALVVVITAAAGGNEMIIQDFLRRSEENTGQAQKDECRLLERWFTIETVNSWHRLDVNIQLFYSSSCERLIDF